MKFISVDMIKHPEKLKQTAFKADDLCLIVVPSYGGRVPAPVVEELKKINGNGAKAVLITVFGNREIDDTLAELEDVLKEAGFTCMAGMEAVAEHSLMHQFTTGRPDKEDEKVLVSFAKQIKEKFMMGGNGEKLELPGNHEYREYNGVPMKPAANRKCISCMHCVSVCPKNARHYSKLLCMIAGQKMKKTCSARKENKLYI